MSKLVSSTVRKYLSNIFEYNYQPDSQTMNTDWNYFWSFPQPGDDVNHYTDYHEDKPYEPLDKVVDRDNYPQEAGGQGELDTVDNWLDTGTHYYILSPGFQNGSSDLTNFKFYKDYLEV